MNLMNKILTPTTTSTSPFYTLPHQKLVLPPLNVITGFKTSFISLKTGFENALDAV